MSTFQVSLPESLKPFLETQAAAEGLESPSAYLQAVIQKMQRRAEIEAKLLEGVEDLENGRVTKMTPAEWDRIRSEFCKRHGLE